MDLFCSTTKLVPRPYQLASIEAIGTHLQTKATNPCNVIPTGGGKSPIMAWTIEQWKRDYPPFRCCVLAHVKELVQQNAEKMYQVWPAASIGIYAAGLRKRQQSRCITFASIDSVFKKACDFDPFDLIYVDEAQRIPASGEGKYRRFIQEAKLVNPKLRVVGMTATPYRLGSGAICHRDHILQEICYEANVGDLIRDGYLCPLRSKAAIHTPDVSKVKKRGGEYIASELASTVDPVVPQAVKEAVTILNAEDRKSIIFFCVDVAHCHHVSSELRKYGIDAPAVTGKTPHRDRDRITNAFRNNELRAICNVNVFTEGFDATQVDAIVLLRPTQSKGLYTQMVGRGLRIDPRKVDCLILDFAGCIETHGPIDALMQEAAATLTCQQCRELFSKAVKTCPRCGWTPDKKEIERQEGEKKNRLLHGEKPSQRSILSEPETLEVDEVIINRHRKPESPDSLRVTYRCGLNQFREWICLDHEGYAHHKAARWWRLRFSGDVPTVDEALLDMFLPAKLTEITKSITVEQKGKWPEITSIELNSTHKVAGAYHYA